MLDKAFQERGKDKETLQDLIDELKVSDSDHDIKIFMHVFKQVMKTMGVLMVKWEIDEIVNDSKFVSKDNLLTLDMKHLSPFIILKY